jgi:excisionase family DNA binding protein
MRVQLGQAHERPVQIKHIGSEPVLVLRKGMPVTDDVVRQLDRVLRGYVSGELRRQRMHRYGDAATALGVSPSFLKARVQRGEYPHHKVGTYVRFTDEDIDRIRDLMARGGDSA